MEPTDADVKGKGIVEVDEKGKGIVEVDEKGKGTYKSWTGEESNELLRLLVDAAKRNWKDKNGSFSKKLVESKILPVLNEKLGRNRSYVEYQSRFKWFKRRHGTYEELLKFSSGFGWKKETGMFDAPAEVWDNYLKSHKGHGWLRIEPCDDYEDLCLVVGNKLASGKGATSLNSEETDAKTFSAKDNRSREK